MAEPLTLECQASIHDDVLSLPYQVSNQHSEVIYLVNRIFAWGPAGLSLDPNLIYTQVDAEGTLQLIKAYLPPPENMKVEAVDVPYLTAVAAGDVFEETLTLKLPLTPFEPYGQAVIQGSSSHHYDRVVLVVGWLPGEKVTVRQPQRPDGLEVISTDYTDVEREQRLLVAALGLGLPMLSA